MSTSVPSPLVLDVHALVGRPGAMETREMVVPAPDGLALTLVEVPVGSDLRVGVRLESVVDGIWVTAQVGAQLRCECARCLDAIETTLQTSFADLFAYSDEDAEPDTLLVLSDTVDLAQPLRDAVVLAMPARPLCTEDCLGLCSQCGARLADDPAHQHDVPDPRWAALAGLSEAMQAEGPTSTAATSGDGGPEVAPTDNETPSSAG